MTKLFEMAVEAASQLSPEEQDALAHTIFGFIADDAEPYVLSEEEIAAIDQGMAEVERGEFASAEEVEALFARYRA